MDNKEVSNKQLFNFLSKPLQWAYKIVLPMTGISVFAFVVFIGIIYDKLSETTDLAKLPKWAPNAIAISLLVLVVSFIALALMSTVSLFRVKMDYKSFNDCIDHIEKKTQSTEDTIASVKAVLDPIKPEMLAETLEKIERSTNLLASESQKTVMANHILNGSEISELESRTVGGARIVVMTSQFHLDKGKLLRIIVRNICKGVIYEYLIPEDLAYKRDFQIVYRGWWNSFIETVSSEEAEEEFAEDCRKLKKLSSTNKGQFKRKAREYFKRHVRELPISKEHRLVTVIMYQQEVQPSDKWEVIMKLPTVTDDDEYYAFRVSDEERKEKQDLIRNIENLCSNATATELELS